MKFETFKKKIQSYNLHIFNVEGGYDIRTEDGLYVAFVSNEKPYNITVSSEYYQVTRELFNDIVRFARVPIEKR